MSIHNLSTGDFHIHIEKDDEGYFIASVPELHGCHTQAKTIDMLIERIQEAIVLCMEVQAQDKRPD